MLALWFYTLAFFCAPFFATAQGTILWYTRHGFGVKAALISESFLLLFFIWNMFETAKKKVQLDILIFLIYCWNACFHN